MGKAEDNKNSKQRRLLDAAYDLFTHKGYSATTISEISESAGTAKGTFYLYFKDKRDLRERLVNRKTSQLFDDSIRRLVTQKEVLGLHTFEDQVFFVVDDIIMTLMMNPSLLKFTNRRLFWGIFRHSPDSQDFEMDSRRKFYLQTIDACKFPCTDPELLLFTIVELVSSTCYSCIRFGQPVSMEAYLPWLHNCIHGIIEAFTEKSF